MTKDKSNQRRFLSFLRGGAAQRHLSWIQFFGWSLLLLGCIYGCFQVFHQFSLTFEWPEAAPEPGSLLGSLYGPIFWRVLGIFAAVFIVNVVLGLILLHRLTGPLVRVEKTLNEIGEGQLPQGLVKFRRNDLVPELSDALNQLIVSCRDKISEFGSGQAADTLGGS